MIIYKLCFFHNDYLPIIIDNVGKILFEKDRVKFRLCTGSGVLDSSWCVVPLGPSISLNIQVLEVLYE